jgi:ATP/maltotriose-dependent transcriptional regulator MalT/DNA-binding SARP family transcriptional activator
MNNKAVLLLTKITAPKARRQLLSRQRLLTQLEQSHNYQLTLISAPAGYGKTTLLTDYARSSDMALCWYALDERDRDPAVFCLYLLHSVRQIYPQFGKSFEKLLGYNATELHQEAIIGRLAEEFIANLEELRFGDSSLAANFRETLLVLDDYQFAESFGVNRFLQRLIWWLPEQFHLIIATRAIPEDLAITKLAAKQMLTILSKTDLAFTTEEISQLLSEFHNISEPMELAEMLTSYSEGWITAIVLVLSNQSLAREGNWRNLKAITSSSGGNADLAAIFDYLATEILANQTKAVQSFLLRTSVFELLKPAECDQLMLGQPQNTTADENTEDHISSEEILHYLETKNLFITRLTSADDGELCYQYHALFRQFLRAKLKYNKSLYKTTQVTAGLIENQKGNVIEAISHYLEAGEIAKATEVLSANAETLYKAGRNSVIKNLLEVLPVTEQEKSPSLLDIKAKLLLETGQNREALQIYIHVENLYRQNSLTNYAARALANQAQLMMRMGLRKDAVALCTQIVRDYATLIKTNDGLQAIGLAKSILGTIAMEEGRIVEAEQNLRDVSDIYKACSDDFHTAMVESVFGQLYQYQGKLVKSGVYYERALNYFVKIGNRLREAYCRTSIAVNYYLQGQYQEAERQLNDVRSLTVEFNDNYLQLFILSYLGNIYRETERYTKAEIIYKEALDLARSSSVRKMELDILSDQTLCYILQNEHQNAHALLQLSFELTEEYNLLERIGLCYINQAYAEFDSHTYKRAIVSIDKAIVVFSTHKKLAEECRAKLILAITFFAIAEVKKAIALLAESLEQANKLGYEPYLTFEFRWATPLFRQVATLKDKVNEITENFLRKHGFIAAFNNTDSVVGILHDVADEQQPIRLSDRRQQSKTKLAVVATNLHALKAYGLDGGRVWVGEVEIEKWRTNKTREILFYLLEYNKCSRDELFEALWPDENFDTSAHLLHTAFYHLRRTIAPVEIKLSAGRYSLEGEIWYDASEFANKAKKGLFGNQFILEDLSAALELYKRDYLDQFYSNWSLERQRELLQLYSSGLEKLARFYQEQGQHQSALPLWRQILRKDEYNEAAHIATINCLLETGNKLEARRQSTQYLKTLEDLDLQPSPNAALLLQKLA